MQKIMNKFSRNRQETNASKLAKSDNFDSLNRNNNNNNNNNNNKSCIPNGDGTISGLEVKLEKDLADMKVKNTNLMENNKKLETEMKELKEYVGEIETENKELNDTKECLNKRVADLLNVVPVLQFHNTTRLSDIVGLKDKIVHLQRHLADLKNKHAHMKLDNAVIKEEETCEQEAAAQSSESNKESDEVKMASKTITPDPSVACIAVTAVKKPHTDLNHLQKSLSKLKSEKKEFEDKVDDLQTTIGDLKMGKSRLNMDKVNLEEKVRSLQKQVDSLKSKNLKLTEERTTLEERSKILQDRILVLSSNARSKDIADKGCLDRTIKSLQKQVAELKLKNSRISKEKDKFENKMKLLQDEVYDLKSSNPKVKAHCKWLEEKVRRFKNTVAELKTRNLELNACNQKLESRQWRKRSKKENESVKELVEKQKLPLFALNGSRNFNVGNDFLLDDIDLTDLSLSDTSEDDRNVIASRIKVALTDIVRKRRVFSVVGVPDHCGGIQIVEEAEGKRTISLTKGDRPSAVVSGQ